jgi:CheY-like chemotaxis protein
MRDYYVGDDMKLKQVLINILGNAVKFTDAPGRVILTVEETGADLETCTLRFKIKDTGIGMDPEFIPKIFDSFAQEHDTRTNHYGGSGLGMAITRNLVVMMNGDIQVESQKGVGTEITVTVLLGRSERVYEEKAEDPRRAELHLLSGRRILIAEDVEQNAEILADLLELEDMEAECAENGEIAVRMFAEQPEGWYDAILMDLRMPVMDGLTAAKSIRRMKRPDAETIPIIAMTANVYEEDMNNSLEAGMNAHLAKPVEPDLLYATLAEQIGKKTER